MKITIRLLLCLVALSGVFQTRAQSFSVKGKVTNASSGEPLSGASVSVKNGAASTQTNAAGEFTISASSNDIIVVTHTGMVSQEKPAAQNAPVNFTLLAKSGELNDVVVIGYGQQSKRVVTSAISKIDSKTIVAIPMYRVEQALQGTTPGVSVMQNSGSPGSPLTVRVRGTGTAGTADPLYIVDGMQVPDLNYLNSSDIDNISILKDAAACAIYGARGGNGVVLVQTKAGKKNQAKPTVTLNGSYGLQNLARKPDLMNRDQWVTYYNDYQKKTNGPTISDADRNKLPNTDWYDAVFEKNAPVYNMNLGVSGGGANYAYYISGGDFNQKGMVGGKEGKSSFDRKNLKATFDIDVVKNLNIKLGGDIVHQERNYLFENQAGTGVALMNYLSALPAIYPAFDSAKTNIPFNMGDLSKPLTVNGVSVPAVGAVTNPFLALLITNNRTVTNIKTYNISGTWKPVKDLTLATSYAYYQDLSTDKNFTPAFDFRPTQNFFNETADLTQTNYQSSYSQWEGNARYKFSSLKDQNLEVLAGFSVLQSKGGINSQSGSDFFVNDFDKVNFALIKDLSRVVVAKPYAFETGLLSFYGRVNYSYKEKYLLTGILRSDASSKFGPNNRTGIFPSVSAGWVVSEESFLKDSKVIDLLKLRASWGINGNNFIGDYQYSTIVNPNSGPSFAGQNTPGISIPYLANPSVKWEQVQQTDIGADINLLHSSLGISFDYYNKKNTGVLIPIGTPAYTGYNPAAANVADVKNSGVEVMLAYRKNNPTGFSWNAAFNLGYNKNKVTSLGLNGQPLNGGNIGFIFPDPITRTDVGQPIASFYGYKVDHIDGDGNFVFKDLDGKNGISDKDKTYLGSPFPDFTYGLNLGASFKGFDLGVFLYGSQGNKIYDATVRLDASYSNRPVYYGEPGAPKNLLGSGATGDAQTQVSDYYVKDGSFAKLKTLTLGYTLPESVLKSFGNIRFYVTGQNLFVVTKYKGLDPEIGQSFSSNTLDVGIDRGFYPQPRTILFGIQAKF